MFEHYRYRYKLEGLSWPDNTTIHPFCNWNRQRFVVFFATSDAKTLSLIKFLFAVFLALRLHTSFYFKMYNMDTLPLTESESYMMDQNPVWSSDYRRLSGALLTSPLICNILLYIGRLGCKKVWCQDIGHPEESEYCSLRKCKLAVFKLINEM